MIGSDSRISQASVSVKCEKHRIRIDNMNKSVLLLLVLLISLFVIESAFASISVGVKKGDWIEYQVSFTGTLPDESHAVNAARLEVEDVQGTAVHIRIVSNYTDGTQDSTNPALNLETGHLIDDFVIPAGLLVGDKFIDSNVGNITIARVEHRTYAGATRTVLSSTIGFNTYFWDQVTGVSVEGITETPSYTMHTLATATNIWQPQNPQPETMTVYILIIVAVVVIMAVVAFVFWRRKE